MKYLYSLKKKRNTLIDTLESLNVKYTVDYASKLFKEHPHKNDLYGLSQMLSSYGIDNVGIKINDKENDCFKLSLPFIAQVGDDFVLVNKFTSQLVSCLWNGEKISVSSDKFNEKWSGVALLIQPNQTSIEPNYKNNKIKSYTKYILNIILFISIIALLITTYINQPIYSNKSSLSLLVIANLLGGYISFLLITKQLHINNEYVDKVCTLFKDGNCNSILESNAAKLWGIIGWSEIGLGYFISNLLIIVFMPHLVSYSVIINICTLPYTLWSVWYQKVIAKQWCILCLIVQAILWLIFIIAIILDIAKTPIFNLNNLLFVGCIYSIPTLLINFIIPYVIEKENSEDMKQEMNVIKSSSSFFLQSIREEPFYSVSNENSKIIFGNKNSKIRITILSNPHCNPCAKIHKKADELIRLYGNKISIQYIFSSSNEKLSISNKLLIAVYLNTNQDIARKIFTDWFEGEEKRFYSNDSKKVFDYNSWGNKEIEKHNYIKNKNFDITKKDIDDEFLKHESWKHNTRLRTTPIILVNGYKLPDYYKLEDLKYHVDLIF